MVENDDILISKNVGISAKVQTSATFLEIRIQKLGLG